MKSEEVFQIALHFDFDSLGLCLRKGKIIFMISDAEKTTLTVGLKQVRKALAEHKAKKVFIAKDCDMFLLEGLEGLCSESGIAPVYAESMKELGQACGIDVNASCACVC